MATVGLVLVMVLGGLRLAASHHGMGASSYHSGSIHVDGPNRFRYPPALRSTANTGCSYVGQFLPNAEDDCSYLVCGYGTRPLAGQPNSNIVPSKAQCPPGTAVPRSFKGGQQSPCTDFNSKCTPPENEDEHFLFKDKVFTQSNTPFRRGGYQYAPELYQPAKYPRKDFTLSKTEKRFQIIDKQQRYPEKPVSGYSKSSGYGNGLARNSVSRPTVKGYPEARSLKTGYAAQRKDNSVYLQDDAFIPRQYSNNPTVGLYPREIYQKHPYLTSKQSKLYPEEYQYGRREQPYDDRGRLESYPNARIVRAYPRPTYLDDSTKTVTVYKGSSVIDKSKVDDYVRQKIKELTQFEPYLVKDKVKSGYYADHYPRGYQSRDNYGYSKYDSSNGRDPQKSTFRYSSYVHGQREQNGKLAFSRLPY